MKTHFILLLISNLINFICLKNSELLSLSVYEGTFIKDTYNLSLKNIDDAKIRNNPSKLAYITNINGNDSIIYNNYSKYFNKIWVFYITNIEQINLVLSKDFSDYEIMITGILIPKSLNYQILSEDNVNEEIPIIEVPENLTLEQYDIRTCNKNIFFVIKQINNLLIPIKYLIAFSIIVLISSIIISLVWNIFEKRVGQDYLFNYHDKIKYIFCAHIFLALTLIFKTVSIMREDNYELTATVEISLTLSSSFFKSLLWFLVYLIAYGWYICFHDLLLNEQKKLVRLLLLIIVTFWIDDILGKYVDDLWILKISEIKNLILYIFLVIMTTKNIRKNLNILKRKYNYALSMLPEYAEGIMTKIKLLSNLKLIIWSYIPAYLLILMIHKLFLYDYDSSILLIYNYLIPDFILEVFFVFLMRPKVVSDFYNVDLGEMFDEVEGNTYMCHLPNFNEQIEEKLDEINFNKKDYDIEEIPIVVIEPYEEENNSNIIDNSNIVEYDINKYFSNIKVGFFNINNNK
jgi:hypothetical protein